MKLYGGNDLHSNNNVLVLIDEKDRLAWIPTDRRFTNTAERAG